MKSKAILLSIMATVSVMTVALFAFKSDHSPTVREHPNILLIVSEDNGPDLGCYGVNEVKSPNLDNLAKSGMLFKNAFVTYSVCSPSRSTIFTGLYPFQNGQIGLATHGYRMYDDIVNTLPVALKKGGYRTGCLGKIHLNPESAIPFDFRPIKGDNFAKKGLRNYAVEAARFMQNSDEPFFLIVNFPDAHFPLQKQVEGMPANPIGPGDVTQALPYVGANSWRLREYTANYYNSMMRLDESVGMLIDSLQSSGKLDNTLIIYLGDHGAQFSRAKCTNYEAGLRVPMIMSWKGHIEPGTHFQQLVSSIDLFPTMLEAAGIQTQAKLPGVSLLPFVTQEKKTLTRKYVFAAAEGTTPFWYFPKRSVRDEQYKLITNLLAGTENPIYAAYETHKGHFEGGATQQEIDESSDAIKKAYATWKNPPLYELYDLEKDPLELNNLASDQQYNKVLSRLIKVLNEWREQSADPLLDTRKMRLFEAEVKAIREKYPNNDYMKDPHFSWNYPTYFRAK